MIDFCVCFFINLCMEISVLLTCFWLFGLFPVCGLFCVCGGTSCQCLVCEAAVVMM